MYKVCLATNNVRNYILEVCQFAAEVSQMSQILTSDVIGPLLTSPEATGMLFPTLMTYQDILWFIS